MLGVKINDKRAHKVCQVHSFPFPFFSCSLLGLSFSIYCQSGFVPMQLQVFVFFFFFSCFYPGFVSNSNVYCSNNYSNRMLWLCQRKRWVSPTFLDDRLYSLQPGAQARLALGPVQSMGHIGRPIKNHEICYLKWRIALEKSILNGFY